MHGLHLPDCFVQELANIRAHAHIWQGESSSRLQKLEAENALLQEQLMASNSSIAAMNARITELRAEKDAAVQV